MGAETGIMVEVAVTKYEWRESYGVISDDALRNVHLEDGESVTGRTKSISQWQEEQNDDE